MPAEKGTYSFSPEVRNLLEDSKLAFAVFQVIDGQYRTLLVSEGACEIFELGHEDLCRYLTNKSYRKMHPNDAGKLIEASKGFLTEDEITVVFRIMRKGSYHPLLFHERPQTMKDGTTLYFVSYYDMSEVEAGNQQAFLAYQDRQTQQLYLDDITELPNINYYRTFAPGTLQEYLDHGVSPLIIFFDIQGMHSYNDRFGYEAGDRLIRMSARLIREGFEGDFCVRHTEDHIVVITGRTDYLQRIGRIRSNLQAYAAGENAESAVDVHAGIYRYTDPAESCVAAVDKARRAVDYIRSCPNRSLCEYDDTVRESYQKRDYVLDHYRQAMRRHWIKVYFQPLVDAQSGRVTHREALSRWVDPTYGFMNPADFIGILEEARKIWEVDLYILRETCRCMQKEKSEGREVLRASVNLSRFDLAVPDIHARINTILDQYGIDHRMISIEITESALAAHEEMIERHIVQFHTDGYKVWLDDFGSGYSSFNALQNFDFDLLKIDMQFLRKQNHRTPGILSSIVDLTKDLDIGSVTEGVETREQYEFLKKIGCGMLQGYYFSKPVPEEEFAAEMERKRLTAL